MMVIAVVVYYYNSDVRVQLYFMVVEVLQRQYIYMEFCLLIDSIYCTDVSWSPVFAVRDFWSR